MKAFPLTLIVISISIICILNIGFVSALNQDELSVSPSWSTSTPSQGDSVTVTLRLTSTCSEQLRIYYIGLHFDWMPENSFAGRDLSDDPVVVPSQGIHIFESMVIQIPANVSVGSHSYFVGIDGLEGSYSSFSWDSAYLTLQILDSSSKVYNELLTQVDKNISMAVNAAYQSVDAQSLLAQAQNERAEATLLASDGKWTEAVSALQSAYSHLAQAEAAEQLDTEQKAGQQTLLLYLGIIAIVGVIAVAIVVVMLKKRKKTDEAVDQSFDQTVDEQPETQDSTPEE